MGGIEIMMRILEDDDWHKIDRRVSVTFGLDEV
jgi:hypothetical protein